MKKRVALLLALFALATFVAAAGNMCRPAGGGRRLLRQHQHAQVPPNLVPLLRVQELHGEVPLAAGGDRRRICTGRVLPAMTFTATYFGTSTILFYDGATRILIDGFFSRPGKLRLAFPLRPNRERIAEALGTIDRIDAIFVAHSHYDHVLDTATVAKLTGAAVFGSESTKNVVRTGEVIDDGFKRDFGRFRVTVFRTPHSLPPRYEGIIRKPLRRAVRLSAYREGGNFSFIVEHDGRAVLVVPSCNLPGGKFHGVRAEAVFLSVGMLGKQDPAFAAAYWQETVTTTGAKRVIPIHWDDPTRRLCRPFKPLPRIIDDFRKAKKMIDELEGNGVRVLWPSAFESFTF
jgi:L-ascorbate metabolism protein UlaG (beta-lactamase superfamily)